MYGLRQNAIVFQVRINGCARRLQWLVEVKDTYIDFFLCKNRLRTKDLHSNEHPKLVWI